MNRVIEQDLPFISEALSGFESYSFPEELQKRMARLGLSSVAMGERAGVSHSIVDRWLKGQAKPNGKERMKELGMGLGMDVEELNHFLYRNGYPRLYVKNPLDSVAIQLLRAGAGREDKVSLYREVLDRAALTRFSVSGEINDLRTSVMLSGLLKQGSAELENWLNEHAHDFVADAKSFLPDKNMGAFLRIYIGDETVYSLSKRSELPVLLAPALSAILNEKRITVRGLREKLIALGLYLNFTEEEIEVLLEFARLRAFAEPTSKVEMAVLLSLREAHGQYALYESENLKAALKRLSASHEPYERTLYGDYSLRYENAAALADYYLNSELSEEEQEFRDCYTSYGDKGLMDYVRDMLTALSESGELEKTEVTDFLELIQRTGKGEDK